MRSLIFGDYMNMEAEGEDRMYEEVKSVEDLTQIVQLSLEEYNQTHKAQMNLVVFRYCPTQFCGPLLFPRASNRSMALIFGGTGVSNLAVERKIEKKEQQPTLTFLNWL